VAPPPERDYTKYREPVREDFGECCAYCLLFEVLAGGRDNFELDHFRPKSRPEFSHLATDFFNIYYSCHVCNHYKGSRWPSTELLAAGCRYVNTCRDEFAEHFTALDDGTWRPVSKPGEYSEAMLRLNRTHLKDLRGMLNQIADKKKKPRIDWSVATRRAILDLLQS